MTKTNLRIKLEFWAVFAIMSVIVFAIAAAAAAAVPNTLTLQGKLTNAAGTPITTQTNLTFRIYDAYTAGNSLYELANVDITPDANGIYDIALQNVNLNFSDQYYLGITVSTDTESTPRINLSSSPYAFRSNISEDLEFDNSYAVTGFNVTTNFVANETFYVKNNKVGIGTNNPSHTLTVIGRVNITGGLNVTGGIRVSGLASCNTIDTDAEGNFKCGSDESGGGAGAALFYNNGATISLNGTRTGGLFDVNASSFTTNYATNISGSQIKTTDLFATTITINGNNIFSEFSDWQLSNFTAAYANEYAATGFKAANATSATGFQDDGTVVRLTTSSDILGIGTTSPQSKLHINDSSEIGAFLITNTSNAPIFFVNASSGKIGIGTKNPIQNGSGILELVGPNSNQNGPHMQFRTTADAYPQLQILPYQHDDVNIGFDSYWDGSAWRSSSSNGNIVLSKDSVNFVVYRDSGQGQGDALSLTEALAISHATGHVGINDSTPDATLEVVGNFIVSDTADDDGNLFAVQGDGNVGIGTAAPTSNFEVTGNASINNTLIVTQNEVIIRLA